MVGVASGAERAGRYDHPRRSLTLRRSDLLLPLRRNRPPALVQHERIGAPLGEDELHRCIERGAELAIALVEKSVLLLAGGLCPHLALALEETDLQGDALERELAAEAG